jgi:hypothetical protein
MVTLEPGLEGVKPVALGEAGVLPEPEPESEPDPEPEPEPEPEPVPEPEPELEPEPEPEPDPEPLVPLPLPEPPATPEAPPATPEEEALGVLPGTLTGTVELPWQLKQGAVEVTMTVLFLPPWVPLLGVPVMMGWVPVVIPVAPVAWCLPTLFSLWGAGSCCLVATPAETPAARARMATEGAVKCILF